MLPGLAVQERHTASYANHKECLTMERPNNRSQVVCQGFDAMKIWRTLDAAADPSLQ